jgi:hypothetical protein
MEDTMRRYVGALSAAIAVSFLLVGVTASPAAAVIKCYKVDQGKGDWKGTTPGNVECKEKTAALEGTWVEAELTVKKKPGLWCAKIFPVGAKTGFYESGTCEKEEANGEYTTVFVEEPCGAGGGNDAARQWLTAWIPEAATGFLGVPLI